MDPQHTKSSSATITVDFLRDRIRHDRDAGDLRPLGDYLAAFTAEESVVAQAYFAVCQESAPPPASAEATLLNRSVRTSILALTAGGPAAPAEATSGGDHVGPYRLLKELGRGGQGAVHLAEDMRLGRRVALKVLTGVGSLTDVNLRRFQREAELASKLDHPAICAVYDFGAFEGVPYIAMRYVEGETLAKRISKAKAPLVKPGASEHIAIDEVATPPTEGDTFTESAGLSTKVETMEVVRIMEKAARAIHAAHEAGVIHRDLKPGNIMVDASGEPVVLDFGLARDLESDGASLTKSGDFFGTPAYMSPEQIASGHIHLDRRSDVYSLGVTLYECLTLRRPFDAPTREALYQAILSKEPPDPRRFNKAISADMKVVLECSLNKDRDKRYVTAEAFADDLRRVRELKPIRAKPVTPLGRVVRWAQRNPAVAVMAITAFLSLAIGLVATLILWAQARQSGAEATASLLDWQRLADARVLENLVREAEIQLWPATPERVPLMEGWIRRADALQPKLAVHRAALAALEARAKPYDDGARRRDRESFTEETERLAVIGPEIERLHKQVEAPAAGSPPLTTEQRKTVDERLTTLEGERRDLDARMSRRVSWEFDSTEDQFRYDNLAALVRGLELFLGDKPGDRPTRKDLSDRLEVARTIRKRTIDDYAASWKDTIAAIARAPAYGGLRMKEQLGLIPLGPDPKSGLFEFTETQTGTPAKRAEDGRLARSPDTALVFVLVPGGTFKMGAQIDSPDGSNYDPEARNDESPVHEVTLWPFFVSKYEMTQSQWLTFTRTNPSLYSPGKKFGEKVVGLSDPVEQATWNECTETLWRLGLVLPTEAQWEYAARAGAQTRWWCGDDSTALSTIANLADQGFKQFGGQGLAEDWDDGYAVHAPVGTFAANRFGLHDVIGNVWEWCRDAKVRYDAAVQTGDGLRTAVVLKTRVFRGGSFAFRATNARSAFRGDSAPNVRTGNIGVRPARVIQQ